MAELQHVERLRDVVAAGVSAASALVREANSPPEDAHSWGQDMEFAERSLRLIDLVETSVYLARLGRYRASLVLARSHIELSLIHI